MTPKDTSQSHIMDNIEARQTPQAQYPQKRMRRLRSASWMRDMLGENHVTTDDLILPLFIIDGNNKEEDIPSLPGIKRQTIDLLCETVKEVRDEGIPAIALFPATDSKLKDDHGNEAINPDNLICRTLHDLKKAVPDVGIITDVALDPYTSHGHDGILDNDGNVLNDETVEILAQQACIQAQAGADIIAPSDMMDGRIKKIRETLDNNGQSQTSIMSYAVKYASGFYGPFRDAVGSKTKLVGDKKTYQMNPSNRLEAFHEAKLDIDEGADILMVKPGLPYLDIIRDIKDAYKMPTFAYHVSGEYAMLKAATQKGWLDYETCLMETLISFKRAGCNGIFTYAARDAAKIIAQD